MGEKLRKAWRAEVSRKDFFAWSLTVSTCNSVLSIPFYPVTSVT